MYKIINIYILLAVMSCFAFAQRPAGLKVQNQPGGFVFETVVLPTNSGEECFFSYRVEYNRLVFVKDADKFISKFSVSVEAVDSLSGEIFRDSQEKEIYVDNFEQTNAPHLYVQGLIKLHLKAGKYKIIPSVFDINTGSEHNIGQIYINIAAHEHSLAVNPLVVKSNQSGNNGFELANYEGNIPFSRSSYNLIIPIKDTSKTSLDLELWNEDSLIFKGTLDDSYISALELQQTDNKIELVNNANSPVKTRNFIFKDVNKKLKEGGVRIKLALDRSAKGDTTFVKYVTWYNKPHSLLNIEYAVKMLKYVASTEEIDNISHYSDIKQYQALFNYWKKYDPTPETGFNEIMEEFYQRVDYAINNFSIITARNGAETDRGKIYIKFGKPSEIERSYADSKDVKEIWHYDSPKRQFVFVDKSGLGNFVLNQNL